VAAVIAASHFARSGGGCEKRNIYFGSSRLSLGGSGDGTNTQRHQGLHFSVFHLYTFISAFISFCQVI
jgi:hypothetical protein